MILAGLGAMIGGIWLTIDRFSAPQDDLPALPLWHGPALAIAGLVAFCFFGRMLLRDNQGPK